MARSSETIASWVNRQRRKPRSKLLKGLRRRFRDVFRGWFRIPRWSGLPVYTTYVPVSIYSSQLHPEVHTLLKLFRAYNPENGGDIPRLLAFALNIKQVLKEGVLGDFAELGVWRGNTAAVLAHYGAEEGRKTILFDTFEGFDTRDISGVDAGQGVHFDDTSVALVSSVVGHTADVEYVKGYFPETLNDAHREGNYAVVSLDCDLYAPTKAGLEFFYPRMSDGGIFLLHDYAQGTWEGCTQAIDEFCAATGERVVVIPDLAGSAFIRKSRC